MFFNFSLVLIILFIYLFLIISMQLVVTISRIRLQKGRNDCGLFALATATCIAAGIDPVSQA